MSDSLPKNCESVREHLDAYLSGQASPLVRNEVSGHLTCCPHCANELETRRKLRESLKAAVQRSSVPPFLEARIRQSLAGKKTERRSLWIWAPAFALAAALAIAFLTGWVGARHSQPWEMAKQDQATFIDGLYGQVVDIMRVGLGDHLHCAYFRKFPDEPPTAEQLVAKIGPQYAPLLPAIREQAPAGHQVRLAHQCVFQDRSFVHIIVEDKGKLLSLVITRKQPGESFRDGSIPAAGNAAGPAIYPDAAEQFAMAGFEAGDYLAFVVSDHDGQENLQWAANLAAPVQRILADRQG
ncbi:MAG: zf-HC2 domain-containing protein [Bryobacterales bacterium]